MTMLAKETETRALTLADYEARIHLYKEQIGTGYIGIGRTLIEAKEAKVVPHGQWESWVTETTGLPPRQAQRCMQAATEIREGSAMARLEMSKALMLLGSGLDEEAREEIAARAADEGATVKQLKEELRKAKLQVVQETGAAAEIREALKKAEEDRDQLERQMRATVSAFQGRLDEEVGKAYQRGLSEQALGLEKENREEFQNKIEFINGERRQADEQIRDLQAKLENAEKAGSARWDAGFEAGKASGRADTMHENDRIEAELLKNRKALEVAEEIRKQQREQINQMKEELEQQKAGGDREILLQAAEEAEKRASDAEAELEALRAGGSAAAVPAAVTLGKAVSAFFSECELMPFYPEDLTKDAKAVMALVNNLADWCRRMRQAVSGVVEAEGAIK